MAYYAALASIMELLEEIIRYSSNGDEAADCLERRIRDVSYRAQDIVESNIHGAKRSFVMFATQRLMYRLSQEYQDLKKVKKEVESIVKEITRIKEIYNNEDFQLKYYYAEVGASKQAASGMVGFDEQLTTIKAQLCAESHKLQIISVVGMGGIGKTTLARNVFDDDLIVYHFHVRIWMTISQDYHIQKVLRAIQDSLKVVNEESREVSDEELSEYIYKHLKGMRYLIVMNNMWDTKVWDDVKRIFPDDSKGSLVLITTRLSDVADYASTFSSVHEMQFFDKEQSWSMLREKVFEQEHCPRELEGLEKSIANNCR
ncbi:hypothetical protein BUALT_Bualt08G0083400 [Buddleja alternifolia]|uniref:NB-ARC domain-containing protein n=1 Tax=Buddleja alternifolia TaxID=168488 RepID=A0AAV6XBZ0_9LAMI|nr:hypothetical protein BUALT_Bualt08G0083400 [Buddleja alternifolia]